jgi:hypothetical protein
MADVAIILEAGATKSLGGPLTQEILHGIVQSKTEPAFCRAV